MVGLYNLVSHRFRGFSDRENTIDGMIAALNFGVMQIEFDVRMTRCGTPMVYHDEYAHDQNGQKTWLKDVLADELAGLGGDFPFMPSLDALFTQASAHPHKAKLLVDIKETGFEEMIYALAATHNLLERTIWVSWVPEVLYAMHDIDDTIPLCLSHWCKRPNAAIRKKHHIYVSETGHVGRGPHGDSLGKRTGWYIKGGIAGKLRKMISAVCVPENMIDADLVAQYHHDDIRVSTFSYTELHHLHRHSDMKIDDYFIDNKALFEKVH